MAKKDDVVLKKELIEFIISKHYNDCSDFEWNGYEVAFKSSGKKPDIDVMRVIDANESLYHDTLLMQGAINFATDVINNAINGGKYAQEI